jgi:hypothetical protein
MLGSKKLISEATGIKRHNILLLVRIRNGSIYLADINRKYTRELLEVAFSSY